MAQWLNWGKGTSGSPNSISGTINTYATCTGTAGQTSLTTALSASAGDQILIHQTQGTGAGNWEICEVVSDAGATLNLKTALVNSYGTGAQAVLIPQYTGGTISGAVTGTAWNGSVGGIIALISNGDLTISGSLSVNALGFRGATLQNSAKTGGKQGEGYPNYSQSRSSAANGNGAGGGNMQDGVGTTGGGGGSNGGAGEAGHTSSAVTPGQPGSTVGNAELTTALFGGGGGGGSCGNVSGEAGGAGGVGAGMVFIFAKNITISGTVSLTGGNGSAGAGESAGGSGAGGSCLIKCQTATLGTNKITASGGARISDNHYGGAGGVGRIHVDYFTSVSGSTTPTLSSAQDLTLNVPASSGFFNFF